MLLLPARIAESSVNKVIGKVVSIFWVAFLLNGCYTYKGSALFQDATAPANLQRGTGSDSLRIRPNDVIRLVIITPDPYLNELWKFEEGLSVSPEGNVKIPMLGDLPAAGLTIPDFEDTLQYHLQRFTTQPYVQVQYLSFEVYVMGEVTQPGQKMLLRQKGTVMDALAQAIPFTELGDIRSVKVIRRDTTGNTRTYVLDLRYVAALNSEGYELLPGDIVYVPPARKALVLKNVYSTGQMYILIQLAILLLTRFL